MAAKKPRSREARRGSIPLDAVLDQDGTRDAFQAVAIIEVVAWQIEEAMKVQGLTRSGLAKELNTSGSQIARLLDTSDGNVTLTTLQRAAELLGRKVRQDLV
jgi:antitoxin HicB